MHLSSVTHSKSLHSLGHVFDFNLLYSNLRIEQPRMQSINQNPIDEQFPVAMAEVAAALTLANICLDMQIGICLFLHPSDILALRKVCRHQKFLLLKSVTYYEDLQSSST